MNIREVVNEVAKLPVAEQAKVIEAANATREANALLAGLGGGSGRRGPKPGSKRVVKSAPVKAAPVKKGGKVASVLTD